MKGGSDTGVRLQPKMKAQKSQNPRIDPIFAKLDSEGLCQERALEGGKLVIWVNRFILTTCLHRRSILK
jgi:hypothetical protein